MTRLITADTVVARSAVLSPGWIAVDGARIAEVGRGLGPAGSDADDPRPEHVAGTVVPGFVDIHTHGAAGADFAQAADRSIRPALDWHLAHGTTSVLASIATGPIEEMARQAGALGALVGDGTLRGVHLEGPFLSVARRGTHAADLLREPGDDALETLLSATDAIRMVTIAPELPGGIRAIERLVASGIVAAVGHTSATLDQARRAFDAGATVATHLFNGMPALHHREPGPVGAALLDERVFLELILDGRHLSDEIISLVLGRAGSRAIAVSDSIAATGAADGEYVLAGTAVRVSDGVAMTTDTGSLAGSTRTVDTAFAALVHRLGCSLPEAVAATSTSAARALGFADAGELAPGMSADLVVLDDRLAVTRVMSAGEWVVGV